MNDSTNSPDNDNLDIFDFSDVETSADIVNRNTDEKKRLYHTYLATMTSDAKSMPGLTLSPHEIARRPTKKETKTYTELTYVYLIYSSTTGLYKIGRSIRPGSRLNAVIEGGQHANPEFTANLVAYFLTYEGDKFERILHEQFSDKRSHKEWFRLSREDVIDLIISLLVGVHGSGWKAPEIFGKEGYRLFIDLGD